MQQLMNILANLSGLAGVLICLVAGVNRLMGQYHLAGSEMTLSALMVAACLGKLYVMEMD